VEGEVSKGEENSRTSYSEANLLRIQEPLPIILEMLAHWGAPLRLVSAIAVGVN
jgi:hypothetical protein